MVVVEALLVHVRKRGADVIESTAVVLLTSRSLEAPAAREVDAEDVAAEVQNSNS